MLEYVLYIVLAMWVSFISNKCPPPIICLVHHTPYNHVATTLCKLHVCWLLYPWWNSLLVALVIINNIVADLTTVKSYLKMACCTMKTISGNASSFRWKIQAKLKCVHMYNACCFFGRSLLCHKEAFWWENLQFVVKLHHKHMYGKSSEQKCHL